MIFEELELYNFGIYKGRHTINLDSPSHDLPVILIGALNGAGKTTFLDALQLVLYGKYAKCSNRGKQSYAHYLEKNINYYAEAPEASIRLKFRHSDDTEKANHYEIVRIWVKNGKEFKESVSISCNKKPDLLLSENWEDFINDIIPQSISELFFFDGEKIEELANPKRSAEILKAGIEALLGLDMLSKLENDLKVIERRKKESQLSEEKIRDIDSLKNELEGLQKLKKGVSEKLDVLYIEKKEINDHFTSIKNELSTRGADKLALKDEFDQQKNVLEKKIYAIKHDTIRLISGALPLKLVSDLYHSTFEQLRKEKEYKAFRAAEPFIIKMQEELESIIHDTFHDNNTVVDINNKIKNFIYNEKKHFKKDSFLTETNLDEASINAEIKDTISQLLLLSEQKKEATDSVLLLERKLATIPNLKDVKHIIEAYAKQEEKLNAIIEKIKIASDELLMLEARIDENKNKYNDSLLKYNAETFEQKRQDQIIKHIESLQNIINAFYTQLVRENIKKLESRIKSKFDQLKRKDSLIDKISIDPDSFAINLFTNGRNVISPERLSAGERQLFSIAILWGLADCSGKELPTIIDTPMGRLDGTHRKHLINKYFPHSSSQLILLSTDEEIYGEYYEKLTPFIAKEYTIEYIEDEKTSVFKKGYLGR